MPTRCSTPPPRRWRSRAWALRIRCASAQLDAPSSPTLPPTLPQWAAGKRMAGCGGAGGPPRGGVGGMGGMAARRGSAWRCAAVRGTGGGGTSSAGAAVFGWRIQGWRSAASAGRRLLGS